MKAVTLTIKGVEIEKTTLPEKLFGVKVDGTILAQAVRVYLSNQRQSSAKTKTRGEVTRTTAKMYKQKGTGRARHGSYSAPIFVGGGVAHGPSGEQNYKLKIPASLKKLAFLGSISQRAKESNILVIVETNKATGKTKEAKFVMDKSKLKGKTLVVVTKNENEFAREWGNIKDVTVLNTNQLNAYIVLRNKNLLITPDAIKEMERIYAS